GEGRPELGGSRPELGTNRSGLGGSRPELGESCPGSVRCSPGSGRTSPNSGPDSVKLRGGGVELARPGAHRKYSRQRDHRLLTSYPFQGILCSLWICQTETRSCAPTWRVSRSGARRGTPVRRASTRASRIFCGAVEG